MVYVLTVIALATLIYTLLAYTFKSHKAVAVIIGVILTAGTFASALINVYIPLMILLVLNASYVVFQIIYRLFVKEKKISLIPFIAAIVLTAAYFGYCAYVAKDVKVTHYDVEVGRSLRIAQISDTHMGLFFTPSELKDAVDLINQSEPDLVVVTGDFVDENTSVETLEEACKVLSGLQSRFGTYYITGNHDDRGKGSPKLLSELRSNNVTPLVDEAVAVGDDFILIGRKDEYYNYAVKRLPVRKILLKSGLDPEGRKLILLDHQPKVEEYFENKEMPVDLMISGHTHGGQIFPANILFALTDEDPMYGLVERGGVKFIISSGASSGMVPFKSATRSEVVIMDLR